MAERESTNISVSTCYIRVNSYARYVYKDEYETIGVKKLLWPFYIVKKS